MIVDYKKLNENANIKWLIRRKERVRYFSTFDMASGYHQIEIREEDIPKSAFSAEGGHFEYVQMPFGLNT